MILERLGEIPKCFSLDLDDQHARDQTERQCNEDAHTFIIGHDSRKLEDKINISDMPILARRLLGGGFSTRDAPVPL